jgi:MYXO-CTERM domain-containing protein
LLAWVCLLVWAEAAHAIPVPVFDRLALGGNDAVNWATIGVAFTTVASPAPSSTRGVLVTVSQPGGGAFERRDEGMGWKGNFNVGNPLLWNGSASGEITLVFSAPVLGAGAQVQRSSHGPFSATVRAFDVDGQALGSFTRNGVASEAQDGSAIFMGLLNDVPNVKRITFAVSGGLAVNQLDLTIAGASTPPAPAPEPGTLALAAVGLAGAAFVRRRS